MDRKAIGRRIRQARLDKRWTQQALADAYGCSQQLVSGLERGEISIDIAGLERLAGVLGKDLYYFISSDRAPVEGNTSPEHFERVQRLLERLDRLPPDRRRLIMDAIGMLLDAQEVADQVGEPQAQKRESAPEQDRG